MILLLLILIGLALIIAANEANHGYFNYTNNYKKTGDNVKTAAPKKESKNDMRANFKDELTRRDRAELQELLDKVVK